MLSVPLTTYLLVPVKSTSMDFSSPCNLKSSLQQQTRDKCSAWSLPPHSYPLTVSIEIVTNELMDLPTLTVSSVLRPGPGTSHVLLRAQASEVPPRQGSHRVAQKGRQHAVPHAEPAATERRRGHGASGGADRRPRRSRGGAGEAEDGAHAEDSLAHRQGPAAAASVQVCPQSNGLLAW